MTEYLKTATGSEQDRATLEAVRELELPAIVLWPNADAGSEDIARGIRHLLETEARYGTYNLTSSGPAQTWADIARDVYRLTGHDPERITRVTTAEYFSSVSGSVAPRPSNSVLDLRKVEQAGFLPHDGVSGLTRYLASRD